MLRQCVIPIGYFSEIEHHGLLQEGLRPGLARYQLCACHRPWGLNRQSVLLGLTRTLCRTSASRPDETFFKLGQQSSRMVSHKTAKIRYIPSLASERWYTTMLHRYPCSVRKDDNHCTWSCPIYIDGTRCSPSFSWPSCGLSESGRRTPWNTTSARPGWPKT